MGVSSLLGFLGSVAFPLLRAKLGTSFTALIGGRTVVPLCENSTPHNHSGVSILVVCDAICAISIFLPSSQFMMETETTNMGPVRKTLIPDNAFLCWSFKVSVTKATIRCTCLWVALLRLGLASTSSTSVLSSFSKRGWECQKSIHDMYH